MKRNVSFGNYIFSNYLAIVRPSIRLEQKFDYAIEEKLISALTFILNKIGCRQKFTLLFMKI